MRPLLRSSSTSLRSTSGSRTVPNRRVSFLSRRLSFRGHGVVELEHGQELAQAPGGHPRAMDGAGVPGFDAG